ncbi:MAG: hypothetical protein ACPGU1_21795 [Myxococcota bacterium]
MHRLPTTLCLALLVASCGGDDSPPQDPMDVTSEPDIGPADVGVDDEPTPLPAATLWERGAAPLLWTDWAQERPALLDVSSWAHAEAVDDAPLRHRRLPDFGVGNGHAFALIGYGTPINSLHSMVGPYYHKGSGFFGDVAVQVLDSAGQPLSWETEWAGWVRGAPVVHTQAMREDLMLSTTDFAPLVGDTDAAIRRALLRIVVVRNVSEATLTGRQLALQATRPQTLVTGGWREVRDERSRTLVAVGEPDAVVGQSAFLVPVGSLAPGGERVIVLASVMDDDDERYDETQAALSLEGVFEALEGTLESWRGATEAATVLVTPDERVNDYFEGQRTIILSQQAYNGSSQPMSEYTGAWLRDQAGPVRYLLASGMAERAREMLDYLWLATLSQGEILNMSYGDYQPEDAMDEPDWATMGVMDGRERAESPSYVPLMSHWYWKATGEGDFLAERLGWMKACLDLQDIRSDLLPFSTDETFRTAMAAAHGHDVFEQFESGFFSANSSFLWVAAAEGLAEMAAALLGDEGAAVASDYTSRAATLRAAAEATYQAETGAYHPYVLEETMAPAPAPFEDVNTKPLWSGYVAADDPAGHAQLAALIDALDGHDGVLVSPLPDDFEPVLDHPMTDGIYTGMSPGYFLSNLAQTHHPLAEAAFNALADHATPSGATPEYHILDDYGPLHAVYDPVGGTGDYPARYRPWEGGILAEAGYAYLVGNGCDAVQGALALAPNLPNNWPWLEVRRLRCGASSVDLRIDATMQGWRLSLTHLEGPALEVALTVPFDAEVWRDDASEEAATEALLWGNSVTHLTPFTLDVQATTSLELRR